MSENIMINERKVIDVISGALNIENNLISINSSSENLEEWDSLSHLSILVALDQWLDGAASKMTDLATATSVKEIIDVLNENIDG
jgi:acyl carrier protein